MWLKIESFGWEFDKPCMDLIDYKWFINIVIDLYGCIYVSSTHPFEN